MIMIILFNVYLSPQDISVMSFYTNIQQKKQPNNLGKPSHHHPHLPDEENKAQIG